jgi:hypothetical protein
MENDDFLTQKVLPPQWRSIFMKKFKTSVENEKVVASPMMKKICLEKILFVNKKLIFDPFCVFFLPQFFSFFKL